MLSRSSGRHAAFVSGHVVIVYDSSFILPSGVDIVFELSVGRSSELRMRPSNLIVPTFDVPVLREFLIRILITTLEIVRAG